MKVAVVVEPQYDGLALLVSEMPVWIVESSENKSSATKIWARKSDAPSTDLTTFKVQDVFQRQENCLGIIDVIKLHHPEMSELLVIGLEFTESLRQGFLDIGYLVETAMTSRSPAEFQTDLRVQFAIPLFMREKEFGHERHTLEAIDRLPPCRQNHFT